MVLPTMRLDRKVIKLSRSLGEVEAILPASASAPLSQRFFFPRGA